MSNRLYETGVFGFGCLILYKGLTGLLFDEPLGLIPAVVNAIGTSILFVYFEKWMTLHLGVRELRRVTGATLNARNPYLIHAPIFAICNIALGLLVVIGFADDFTRLSLDFGEDWLLFAAVLVFPTAGLVAFSRNNAKKTVQKSLLDAKRNGVR